MSKPVMWIRILRMQIRIHKIWSMRIRTKNHKIYFESSFKSKDEKKYFQICTLTLEISYFF